MQIYASTETTVNGPFEVEFYDCEGTVICEFGGFDGRNTCPDFENSVSNMELIYSNEVLLESGFEIQSGSSLSIEAGININCP